MKRKDGRAPGDLRSIQFIKSPQKDPAGSVLVEWGDTKVICSASLEEKVPPWMNPNQGKGWISAEYSMLPGSSDKRIGRDRVRNNGRTHEIQRLIGRSLRAIVDFKALGPRTLLFDCDVLQADGGTRVASITGCYLALELACQRLMKSGKIERSAILSQVAAVSVGKVNSEILTDLNYPEDSSAELDANVVMNSEGKFIELQGTAEVGAFSRSEWDELLSASESACQRIFELQRKALEAWDVSNLS